ncbi:MAG TPA: hypothetical protein VLX92_14395 [Kofleriaceae bacterium]|nr:hypothetical protein [Kofleriaceae bacterium]
MMKLLILLFAAVGIVSLLMEFESFKEIITHPFAEGAYGLIITLGFVLPALMGLMALGKPPLQPWQAVVSLGGFAAVGIKTRFWEGLPHFMDQHLSGKLALVAIVGGLLSSLVALLKPESAA